MTKSDLPLVFKLKTKFNHLIKDLTTHGHSNIVNSSNLFRQIFWLLVVLFAWSYCSLVIVDYVFEYFEYRVVSNIDIVYENQPEFPTVQICDHNKKNITCHFNTEPCFNESLLENSLLCTKFNAGSNLTGHFVEKLRSKEVGKNFALKLRLYTRDRYTFLPISINIYNHSSKLNYHNSIHVSRGMLTDLVINRVFVKRLGPPYSNCSTTVEFKSIPDKFSYIQIECFDVCFDEKLAEACQFIDKFLILKPYFYKNESYYKDMKTRLMHDCYTRNTSFINMVREKFNKEGIFLHLDFEFSIFMFDLFAFLGADKACEQMCPIECNSISYSVQSHVTLLTGDVNESIGTGCTEVNIYYEKFESTIITQVSKLTHEDLFGNIGGIIGGVLGASVISLVEVFEMVFWLIFIVLEHVFSAIHTSKDKRINKKSSIKSSRF